MPLTEPSPGTSERADVFDAEHLRVSLGGVPILRDVSMRVAAAEMVALLGGNGSGKTTLVRAALGLVAHDRGTIRLFGAPLEEFRDWARIGYVPQRASVTMHSTTVAELIASGTLSRRRPFQPMSRSDRVRVGELIERVGLSAKAHEAFVHLSGGQQQRVLIARALVSKPSFLIMDEPLAGVDLTTQQKLADLVGSLRRDGLAVLVVLHETEALASLIDRAVVLQAGRVIQNGPLTDSAHAHEHVHPDHRIPILEEVRPWSS